MDATGSPIASKVDKPNHVLTLEQTPGFGRVEVPMEGDDLGSNKDATLPDSKGEVTLEEREDKVGQRKETEEKRDVVGNNAEDTDDDNDNDDQAGDDDESTSGPTYSLASSYEFKPKATS